MSETISDRARELFDQARVKTANGVQKVLAEQTSQGLLKSGNTIRRVAEVHGTITQQALGAAIESIGRRVDSRGLRWRRMIAEVRRELDTYLTDAEQALNKELLKVRSDFPKLAEPLLVPMRDCLHRDLDNYREGWAGTPGKPWSERHKVLYTILAALGGAALSVVTGIASKLVEAVLKIAN